jgi:CheY-like chemotaxis protein
MVSAARSAQLEGAERVSVPAQASAEQAWALVREGTGVGDERLAQCVADHFGLDVADTTNVSSGAARLIPGGVLERLDVVPVRCTDAELVVAIADPSTTGDANRELSNLSGRKVVFEVASPSAIRESRLRHAPPVPPSRRVLVVDDDRGTRVLLRKVLETVGFEVEEAENGAEALELLGEGHGFDLVTLDLYMDAVHGLEVLERLRANKRTANLPILVATASNDPAMQMKVLDAGADDFVTKPLDATRFVLRVRAVLRRREKRGLGHLV